MDSFGFLIEEPINSATKTKFQSDPDRKHVVRMQRGKRVYHKRVERLLDTARKEARMVRKKKDAVGSMFEERESRGGRRFRLLTKPTRVLGKKGRR